MRNLSRHLKEKIVESMTSVLPITAIVVLLSITFAPFESGTFLLFLFGAILLIFGMGFFTLGAEMSMTPMGEEMGISLSKSKYLIVSIIVFFLLGTLATIAEPDLQVLAEQIPTIENAVLIFTVAVGVGIMLVVAALRVRFGIALRKILVVCYGLIFILAVFIPSDFVPVSFDSGGVTTGPVTVPFIMALGVGIASLRSDKFSSSDSFGLVALCSVGPIIATMLLGLFYKPTEAIYTMEQLPAIVTTMDAAKAFLTKLPHYFKEVAVSLFPIILLFTIFQIISKQFKKRQLVRIVLGLFYTYLGLSLFLCGVNVGFLPAGQNLGNTLALSEKRWLLIPIGMLIGFFIVRAEPAVAVLTKQVEEVSNGSITHTAMNRALSIGVCLSVGISMIRVLTGFSILPFLFVGYFIAIALSFYVPPIFTGIAFDSGGVASGPMTATFLLPFAMGACAALGGNIMADAFGIIAMVAMTPLVTIQLMGLTSQVKQNRARKRIHMQMTQMDDTIIFFD